MKFIQSKENNLIKKIRSLSVKKYREQFALYLVEGEKVVLEALKINGLVEYILIVDGSQDKYESIIDLYNEKVLILPQNVYESITNTVSPQSIMAVVKKKPEVSLGGENLLVLDHLQDPGNLGTIIRSAVASGFNEIVLINSVDPFNDKTIRSASGTIFYPSFKQFTSQEFIDFAIKNKYNILIAEAGKNNIFNNEFKVQTPYALVIGNEGNGVSDEIRGLPHTSISIPMAKEVESLNAAISASIIMFNLKNKF